MANNEAVTPPERTDAEWLLNFANQLRYHRGASLDDLNALRGIAARLAVLSAQQVPRDVVESLVDQLELYRVDLEFDLDEWEQAILDDDYVGCVDRHKMACDARERIANLESALAAYEATKGQNDG